MQIHTQTTIYHHLLKDMSKYERLIEKHVQEWDETTMGKLPQTATYEHTVMRVKTMAPSALSTRYVSVSVYAPFR